MQVSANNLAFTESLTIRSLMYNKNNTGPRIDPCGTPDLTTQNADMLPSILTKCWRLARKSSTHHTKLTSPKVPFNIINSLLWLTWSKAFMQSKNITSISRSTERHAWQALPASNSKKEIWEIDFPGSKATNVNEYKMLVKNSCLYNF